MARRYSEEDQKQWMGLMTGSHAGSQNWETGKTRLTLAIMESQLDVSEQLTALTDGLVKATNKLEKLTVVLVWATVVLVIATLYLAFKEH